MADEESANKPAWAPPEDLTDQEALLAYLREREQHPEWPRMDNSIAEWAPLLASLFGAGGAGLTAKAIAQAASSISSERGRMSFYNRAIDLAERQGTIIDPADIIRASRGGDPDSATPPKRPQSGA